MDRNELVTLSSLTSRWTNRPCGWCLLVVEQQGCRGGSSHARPTPNKAQPPTLRSASAKTPAAAPATVSSVAVKPATSTISTITNRAWRMSRLQSANVPVAPSVANCGPLKLNGTNWGSNFSTLLVFHLYKNFRCWCYVWTLYAAMAACHYCLFVLAIFNILRINYFQYSQRLVWAEGSTHL